MSKHLRILADQHPEWTADVVFARMDPVQAGNRNAAEVLHITKPYPEETHGLCGRMVARITEPWSGLSYTVCRDCVAARESGKQ